MPVAGAVIGGGIGAVGSILGGRSASRSASRAASDQNELNYRMFREARGEGGNALLPLYFGNREQELGNTLFDTFDATRRARGGAQAQIARNQETADQFRSAFESGNSLIN